MHQIALYSYDPNGNRDIEEVEIIEGEYASDLWENLDLSKHIGAILSDPNGKVVALFQTEGLNLGDRGIVVGGYLDFDAPQEGE